MGDCLNFLLFIKKKILIVIMIIIKFLITKRTIMRTRKVVTNMIMITVIKRLRTRILEKK